MREEKQLTSRECAWESDKGFSAPLLQPSSEDRGPGGRGHLTAQLLPQVHSMPPLPRVMSAFVMGDKPRQGTAAEKPMPLTLEFDVKQETLSP